jgi:cytochrome-b5 reductase
MSAHTAKPTGPLAPQYITGVYVPSAILIIGTAAFKLQWLPLALAVCAALGGYQVFSNRTTFSSHHH